MSEVMECLRPTCGRPVYNRGLCSQCYQVATTLVRNGESTWDRLIAAGRVLPVAKERGRGDVRTWLLGQDPIIRHCPFCGNPDPECDSSSVEEQCVVCSECGASGPTAGNNHDATRYWNERSGTPIPTP